MKDNIFLKILEKEKLTGFGICGELEYGATTKEYDTFNLIASSVKNYNRWCWGYNGTDNQDYHNACSRRTVGYKITPLRQTILMLCNEIMQNK